jgi:hypothetical protein
MIFSYWDWEGPDLICQDLIDTIIYFYCVQRSNKDVHFTCQKLQNLWLFSLVTPIKIYLHSGIDPGVVLY